MNLLQNVWKLFGPWYTANDSYKRPTDGKGLFQRYNEMFSADLLENEYSKISNFVTDLINYETAEAKFLKLLETSIGINSYFIDNEALRRKFLKYAQKAITLRGTERSYEILFRILGFVIQDVLIADPGPEDLLEGAWYYVDGLATGEVTIETAPSVTTTVATGEYFFAGPTHKLMAQTDAWLKRQTIYEVPLFSGTWDDEDRELDSPTRTFDSDTSGCSSYDVYLYGDVVMNPILIRAIYLCIRFVEPINADIRYVYYNDILVLDTIIELYIDEFGDLIFNNDPDPNLMFEIIDGDLYVNGVNEAFYAKDIYGNLIYTG